MSDPKDNDDELGTADDPGQEPQPPGDVDPEEAEDADTGVHPPPVEDAGMNEARMGAGLRNLPR